MPFQSETLLSREDARGFDDMEGTPINFRRFVDVSVSLDEEYVKMHLDIVLNQIEARFPSVPTLALPTIDEYFEYLSDILFIRVAECREDASQDPSSSPRIRYPRPMRNQLRVLPFWLNVLGAVGHTVISERHLTLLPNVEFEREDSGDRLKPLYEPRHVAKIATYHNALEHFNIAHVVPALPRDKEGVQHVMMMFWAKDDQDGLIRVFAPFLEKDPNAAFIAAMAISAQECIPTYYPLVKYASRRTFNDVVRHSASRELTRPQRAAERKPRNPATATPALGHTSAHDTGPALQPVAEDAPNQESSEV
jgi:hypothetical protein